MTDLTVSGASSGQHKSSATSYWDSSVRTTRFRPVTSNNCDRHWIRGFTNSAAISRSVPSAWRRFLRATTARLLCVSLSSPDPHGMERNCDSFSPILFCALRTVACSGTGPGPTSLLLSMLNLLSHIHSSFPVQQYDCKTSGVPLLGRHRPPWQTKPTYPGDLTKWPRFSTARCRLSPTTLCTIPPDTAGSPAIRTGGGTGREGQAGSDHRGQRSTDQ